MKMTNIVKEYFLRYVIIFQTHVNVPITYLTKETKGIAKTTIEQEGKTFLYLRTETQASDGAMLVSLQIAMILQIVPSMTCINGRIRHAMKNQVHMICYYQLDLLVNKIQPIDFNQFQLCNLLQDQKIVHAMILLIRRVMVIV